MPEIGIVWAQAAQEGEIYKVAGVDNEGMLSLVWDMETGDRMEYVLRILRAAVKKYDIDHTSQWWRDLCLCVEFMAFMVPRQREAKAIQKQLAHKQPAEITVITPSPLTTPYSSEDNILGPQHKLWKSFLLKLKGNEGVRFSLSEGKAVWYCNHTLRRTRAILQQYVKDGIDVEATLEFFHEHGGTCDCKVLFDVLENYYRG